MSTIDDLVVLNELNMYGAIVGKAIYAGNIDLIEAIERVQVYVKQDEEPMKQWT